MGFLNTERSSTYITFDNSDLPFEGIDHNKALYLTVSSKNRYITMTLIDYGSSFNIYPTNTTKKLGLTKEYMTPST